MIRLYGHLQGSFRTVSEGLRLGLQELDVLAGYVIGEQQDIDSAPVPGATAPVAIVVGDPMRVMLAHMQGEHQEVWLVLAPNSEGIPPELKQQLQGKMQSGKPLVTGFLAPSFWAQNVLQREFPQHPVWLCHHGVLPEFRIHEEIREAVRKQYEIGRQLTGLHFTSTNMGRKCTKELIRAWVKLSEDGRNDTTDLVSGISCQLVISCNPIFFHEFEQVIQDTPGAEGVVTVDIGQDFSFSKLAQYMSGHHLIVQPSRAEGFGLVPLEARACGIPVVATHVTGHDDHCYGPGCVKVKTGELSESDDYWGAKAPTVSEEEIYRALRYAAYAWSDLDAQAKRASKIVHRTFKWASVLSRPVERWERKYGKTGTGTAAEKKHVG